MALTERQLLDALSQMPFVDSAELAGILGEPHATVHRALTGLLAAGVVGRVSHGTAHLPSSQRYYLASRGVGFDTGDGLRQYLEAYGFGGDRLQASGLFTERGAERFAGMVVVPDLTCGRVRWLVGRAIDPERSPRFQALPVPKPVLGLGRLGLAPSWAVVAEGLFDWLALDPVGPSRRCSPGHPERGEGRPLPALACTGGSLRSVAARTRASGPLPFPQPAPPSGLPIRPSPSPHPRRSYAQLATGLMPCTRLPVGDGTAHVPTS